jgi:opacity protein-like surface antigen
MKKFLLAAFVALSVTGAMAATVTIDAQNTEPGNGSSDIKQLQLTVKQPINDLLAVDASISNAIIDDSYKQITRYEAGLTAQKAVFGPVDAYGRVGLGQKNISANTAGGMNYYSGEIGVIYHTPVAGLDAKVGYRYRNSFDSAYELGEKSNSFRYALSYALTKKDTIGVRYDRVNGDLSQLVQGNTVGAFYSRNF